MTNPYTTFDNSSGAQFFGQLEKANFVTDDFLITPYENGGDKSVHGSGGISQPRAE